MSALRKRTKARIVYDFDDAVWPPWRAAWWVERSAGNLTLVDAITTDSPFKRELVRKHNAQVFIFPDPSQLEMFDVVRSEVRRSESEIVIGWVSSRGTLFNLYQVWEGLERVSECYKNVVLRLVGTGRDAALQPKFEHVKYSVVPYYDQSVMIREVLGMHIGFSPLFDIEEPRSKGVTKPGVYMAGGAVALASPRGLVPRLIQDGRNGFLLDSPAEWESAQERLVTDAELRSRISVAGLAMVRRVLSLEESFAAFLAALEGTAEPDAPARLELALIRQ